MALKEKVEAGKGERDILIRDAPGVLHYKLEMMAAGEKLKGRGLTKTALVVELLLSHPKLKAI